MKKEFSLSDRQVFLVTLGVLALITLIMYLPFMVVDFFPPSPAINSLLPDDTSALPIPPNTHRSKYITGLRNLTAQEGMWRAATQLVLLTAVQIVIGSITLVAVVMTYRQQRKELAETIRVNNLQLKPYVSFEFVSADFFGHFNSDARGDYLFEIKCRIKNNGKTPAFHVSLTLEADQQSYIKCERNGPIQLKGQDIFVPEEPSSRSDYMIPSDSKVEVIFQIMCAIREKDRCNLKYDVTNKNLGKLRNLYEISELTLNNLRVAYKDLECEGTSFHKLICGSLGFSKSIGGWSSIDLSTTMASAPRGYFDSIESRIARRRVDLDKESKL